MERTFVMLKPDAVNRRLLGEIIGRIEKKGLKIVGLKMIMLNDKILDIHYAHHKNKAFFPRLKKFMSSSPVVAMVVEGVDAVEVVRKLCGPTNGREAVPGTIRGDFSMSVQSNLVHASDSKEKAEEEIKRFFKKEEIFNYPLSNEHLVYSKDEING